MKISQSQLSDITASYIQDYVSDVLAYLTGKYPAWALAGNESREKFIRLGIRKADRYNLLGKKEATAYLEYSIRYGVDFESRPEHAWAARILRIRNLQGAEKLHRLLEQYPL